MLLCDSQGWVCDETVSSVFSCCSACFSNHLPTRNRVVYLADQNTDGVYELYSVPIGGGTPAKLNGLFFYNGQWHGHRVDSGFQISADSSRVVYLGRDFQTGIIRLYSASIGGGYFPAKLNGPLVTNGDVLDFQISADSNRVVYWADQDIYGVCELYSVPITGAEAVKLNRALPNTNPNGSDINDFSISPDSKLVVYEGDQDVYDEDELFGVQIKKNDGISLPFIPLLLLNN